ncbi:MAG: transposase [Lachnospiraceae bacterium]|nr:transposase [Lachnospiraceae bacterium]
MAVPASIRAVKRPPNTIVGDNGRDGPNRYPVRLRSGVKYVPGGNPQPRNGKVIGHIIDGKYVPINAPVADAKPAMLQYGAAAFVHSVSADLLEDLLAIFAAKDAYSIMAIASLRVIRPSIPSNRLASFYRKTFISRYYPGVALSGNTVSSFLSHLGEDISKRRAFYQKRADRVIAEHHIAIDGMLKQDNSSVNDLSAFSHKARVRGCKEVSVLYAYDIERMEPVCAEVFPGNSIDASSYAAFIKDNDIRKGIIVSDKGFPPSRIRAELEERPDLHFLTPVRRNDVRIKDNGSLNFDGVLEGVDGHILYSKRQIKGGRFLYTFRDSRKAEIEEATFLANREKNKDFSYGWYDKKSDVFGVIVFESDEDLDPKTAYICYSDRWLLELVFNRYKNDLGLDRTCVQGDFSVMGSEFISFVATVLTCRMLRKATAAGLLETESYGDLLEDLSEVWREADAPDHAATNDGHWIHTMEYEFSELEALGLSEPIPKPVPKKRGRPRKNPVQEDKPKRRRGRPRKQPLPDAGAS